MTNMLQINDINITATCKVINMLNIYKMTLILFLVKNIKINP